MKNKETLTTKKERVSKRSVGENKLNRVREEWENKFRKGVRGGKSKRIDRENRLNSRDKKNSALKNIANKN